MQPPPIKNMHATNFPHSQPHTILPHEFLQNGTHSHHQQKTVQYSISHLHPSIHPILKEQDGRKAQVDKYEKASRLTLEVLSSAMLCTYLGLGRAQTCEGEGEGVGVGVAILLANGPGAGERG